MRSFKAVVSYDGTRYQGWQRQKKGPTVQSVVEDTLRKFVSSPVKVHAASRTDAGVHARGQVIHFKLTTDLSDRRLKVAINACLPHDIALQSLTTVKDAFHSRYHAKSKLYRYVIYRGLVKPMFDAPYVNWVRGPLNISRMRRASKSLVGRHDFTSFSSRSAKEKSHVRSVDSIIFRENSHRVEIDIRGKGFLRNMVRVMVGTLINVGAGKLQCDDVPRILKATDRKQAGPTAKAKGLTLLKVYY